MNIETRVLTPKLWPQLEELFGSNGACGGCWCMAWRVEKDESFKSIQGPIAKRRLKRGVAHGDVLGILAFAEGMPVRWCTFGPRLSFPRLDRAPSLKCDDPERVWSIPCFFVKAGYRRKGVARALLAHALLAMKTKKAKIVEGYPVKPNKDGSYIAAFSWTGTRPLFSKQGFFVVGNKGGGKQRVRKFL